jgi:3-mercaptopyruvate sulfurtransferase SseA
MQCLGILLVAVAAGVIFNLTMPQGVGWLPREISQPLWRPVDMQEAYRLYQYGARFVDARDPGDYLHARVRGAISLPPEEFERYYPLLKDLLASSEVIVVYGKTFSRFPAARIAQRLAEMGHAKVVAADLCLGKWEQAGFPLKQPRGRRQQ